MKNVLIVSTLDYRYYDNNRVHHIVDQFQCLFDDVFLMFTKAYLPGRMSPIAQMWGFVTMNTTVFRKGAATCIEVDPFLNRIGGLAISLLKIHDPYVSPSLRFTELLRRILSPIGILTELGIVPSLLIAYCLRIGKKVDVVVGQGPWEVTFCLALRKLGLAKTVVYDDFDYAPGNVPVSGLRRRLVATIEKACLERSDLIISVGELLADLREKEIGRKVVVIPNGVDYHLFRSAQEKVAHDPTIVYMGFVSEWSGVETVCRSLPRVKEHIPSIRFLIAGHGTPEYLERLTRLRREIELEDSVLYLGKLPYSDLVSKLRQSDIGMALFRPIPLRKYAFPLKVVEYFAAGLPVITTSGLQAARIVEDAEAGVAVDYSEPAVGDAIVSLLKDEQLRRRYAVNAAGAARSYDWHDLMRKAYEAIQSCHVQRLHQDL